MLKKETNLGLAILRTLMCFMVVLCHFWDAADATGAMKAVAWLRNYAVPVFMLLSFALVSRSLVQHDKEKMKKRFERLLIPQIGWAVIYWGIYFVLDCRYHFGLENGIKDLFWQMFFGHSQQLNPAMWFQVDLIYLTLLFLGVIRLFPKRHKLVLLLLGAGALFAQYSGANLIFSDLPFELKFPLGRFTEMIPLAVTGFFMASYEVLERVKAHRGVAAIFSLFTIAMVYGYGIFTDISGYNYQGIKMIVVGSALVVLFYVLPLENVPPKIRSVVTFLTSYTLGIYCIHVLIETLLTIWTPYLNISMNERTFSRCIVIYVISFLCAWVGAMATKRTKLKLLFE